jgi:endoglucanase
MIPNQAFKQFVIDIAKKEGIPYQLSVVAAGGTDAGKFHVVKAGAPAIVISVPTRHIHSHAAIVDLSDIDNSVKLVPALVRRLDAATVKGFTRF